MIQLHTEQPFAKGGNRLCFVHPLHPDRCIKVRRPDFTLEDLRRSKGFPKKWKPLSSFDDNAEEFRVMADLQAHIGDAVWQHISRCYGFVDTDMGKGLVSELIRDDSQRISYSLKQLLAEYGDSEDFRQAADQLCQHWDYYGVPSRDLLLHNVVAQRDTQSRIRRLVVIDGLGSSALLPFFWLPKSARQAQAHKKTENFKLRIERFLEEVRAGKKFSQMGQLLHDGLPK